MYFYWHSGTVKKCRLSLLYSHPTLICLPSVEGVGMLLACFVGYSYLRYFPSELWITSSADYTSLHWLTVQEHRFLTIIYKHGQKLFSREDCANNHIACISQADWKKLFSSTAVQWYSFSNQKDCIMKKPWNVYINCNYAHGTFDFY